ncbi:MAG TPA: response regulator transcription factor [Noviherbaspirillum sp.]
MGQAPIRILLVDDHVVVRNGVRLMLGSEADMAVVAEASNAQEALQAVKGGQYDVALVDIAMQGMNGLDLLRHLRTEAPKMEVLMLSTYAEDVYAVRAFKLGAAGYLTKDTPAATLIAAVRKAAAGGKYLSPALAERIAELLGGGEAATHEALSNRELEVMKMIAAGESLTKIAGTLHLSPNTVTTYRARIFQKLGVTSNAELTRYAIENGLLV